MNLELRNRPSVLAAAACALLLAPLLAFGEQATFEVTLSGPEASGDPDGRGEATVTMNPETNEVEVRLSYSNIAPPTALHIREGAVGSEGNVVVPIVIESNEDGTLVGRRKSAKPNIIATIAASPEKYYLVVLNREYPVGALRGQIRK
ncbi:MAG TPA: CHRD domain-containing protein [Gammaproteobacteria bacterium]